jgi:hypothetical protein
MGAELLPRIRNVCSVAPARQFRPTRGSETPSGLRGASPGAAFRTTSGVGVAIGCKMHRFKPRRRQRRAVAARTSAAQHPQWQKFGAPLAAQQSPLLLSRSACCRGPLPTARIENPMRNLAQSTEITDIEPFSYPACVEEKRFQKLTGVTGILVAQHPFGQQVRTGEHQECVLAGDTNGNQCWSPHSHTYASRQMEPAVIPSRSRPALASSHRRRRKNLAHPKCVQQPSNRRGAPSTVLIGRWRGLWH